MFSLSVSLSLCLSLSVSLSFFSLALLSPPPPISPLSLLPSLPPSLFPSLSLSLYRPPLSLFPLSLIRAPFTSLSYLSFPPLPLSFNLSNLSRLSLSLIHYCFIPLSPSLPSPLYHSLSVYIIFPSLSLPPSTTPPPLFLLSHSLSVCTSLSPSPSSLSLPLPPPLLLSHFSLGLYQTVKLYLLRLLSSHLPIVSLSQSSHEPLATRQTGVVNVKATATAKLQNCLK